MSDIVELVGVETVQRIIGHLKPVPEEILKFILRQFSDLRFHLGDAVSPFLFQTIRTQCGYLVFSPGVFENLLFGLLWYGSRG